MELNKKLAAVIKKITTSHDAKIKSYSNALIGVRDNKLYFCDGHMAGCKTFVSELDDGIYDLFGNKLVKNDDPEINQNFIDMTKNLFDGHQSDTCLEAGSFVDYVNAGMAEHQKGHVIQYKFLKVLEAYTEDKKCRIYYSKSNGPIYVVFPELEVTFLICPMKIELNWAN